MTVVLPFRPFGFDAMTTWPFVFVHRASTGDAGLLEHELVHYREQAWSPLWGVRYWCSRTFRMAAEVRAYRRQMAVGGIGLERAAGLLATRYRLGITLDQARAALLAAS